jgi:hypothetical protein
VNLTTNLTSNLLVWEARGAPAAVAQELSEWPKKLSNIKQQAIRKRVVACGMVAGMGLLSVAFIALVALTSPLEISDYSIDLRMMAVSVAFFPLTILFANGVRVWRRTNPVMAEDPTRIQFPLHILKSLQLAPATEVNIGIVATSFLARNKKNWVGIDQYGYFDPWFFIECELSGGIVVRLTRTLDFFQGETSRRKEKRYVITRWKYWDVIDSVQLRFDPRRYPVPLGLPTEGLKTKLGFPEAVDIVKFNQQDSQLYLETKIRDQYRKDYPELMFATLVALYGVLVPGRSPVVEEQASLPTEATQPLPGGTAGFSSIPKPHGTWYGHLFALLSYVLIIGNIGMLGAAIVRIDEFVHEKGIKKTMTAKLLSQKIVQRGMNNNLELIVLIPKTAKEPRILATVDQGRFLNGRITKRKGDHLYASFELPSSSVHKGKVELTVGADQIGNATAITNATINLTIPME